MFAEAAVTIRAEAEVANRAVDEVPIDPNVRVSEPMSPRLQPVVSLLRRRRTQMGKETFEATRQMVRLAQGNLCGIQLDENQWRTKDVPLDQKAITIDAKQRAVTQLTSNNYESGIGDLRSVAGHQAERADSMLPIEAMKYSANTIADVSYQFEHYTRKLWDRNKCVAKHFSVMTG